MIYVHVIFALIAFLAANYVNIVTFYIIHRMKKCTPWPLAVSVILAAALGSFTWLKLFSYISGFSSTVPVVPSILIIAVALALGIMPKIDVYPHHKMKVH